ncbi:translation initiation factor IF-2 [Candidatus Korarchaeum cryptofilum]|uniref:Probable translation initiation factor IF-2 n=2 Tax=Candidatus Korarchaeum cryptofilum TaxID=498846 RepID=B1L5N7_KORCO|nr:translation initiation factor IF-2 [Candidatus Korarchaeum cryptofilum]ACB07766.1 translation initiation factor aIF-2 [Candidatus Korarchaeum cryptofilum OPF8]RSN70570.1 translation initiation factor IF-2 [Candidatus Korarchaeum cryptofilum]
MPEKRYRQPLVSVLGHVDSGKTTLLDYIRKTRVASKEPGSITQHVGASEIPVDVIYEVCRPVMEALNLKFEVKTGGLLFIDLPGHEAFSNLRRRGGSVADIAILVIDINGGVQPQTIESINILRERRVPFVIALNKIDTIYGWKSQEGRPFIVSEREQSPSVIAELERRLYRVVDQLMEHGINAERYDRIKDFTKTFAIVPTSAVSGEGVPDLLTILFGLVQRYMLDRLEVTSDEGKGTVLEVRQHPGLGTVLTAIIYDGTIKKGDTIVVAGSKGPIVTKVRSLLVPEPLQEMRMTKKFRNIDEVSAAAGVMISAPDLEDVLAGSPIYVVRDPSMLEEMKREVQEEVERIVIKTDRIGVIVKADALGTLEALISQLEREGIPIRRADIGEVTKADVFEASVIRGSDERYSAILAFNVKVSEEIKREALSRGVAIFEDVIIYTLIEKFKSYLEDLRRKEEERVLSHAVFPAEILVLPNFVFRRSDPAIVGVEVLSGSIRPGYPLISESGRRIGIILDIQHEGNRIPEAKKGQRVAVSIRGGVVGRNVKEGKTLYTEVSEFEDERSREIYFGKMSDEEKELYRKIIWIKYSGRADKED